MQFMKLDDDDDELPNVVVRIFAHLYDKYEYWSEYARMNVWGSTSTTVQFTNYPVDGRTGTIKIYLTETNLAG